METPINRILLPAAAPDNKVVVQLTTAQQKELAGAMNGTLTYASMIERAKQKPDESENDFIMRKYEYMRWYNQDAAIVNRLIGIDAVNYFIRHDTHERI